MNSTGPAEGVGFDEPRDGVGFSDASLCAVDAAVVAAVRAGSGAGLPVLDAGEISVVLAWPVPQPTHAVKTGASGFGATAVAVYAELVERYLARLAAAGVATLATQVRLGPSGRGYLVQPLCPADRIGHAVLATMPTAEASGLLRAICEKVVAATSTTLAVDPHVANWVVGDDGAATLLDVGTPMLRSPDGSDELDFGPYVEAVPPLLRPVVTRLAPALLAPYFDLRGSLSDLAYNLHKVGLARLVDVAVAVTGEFLDRPLDAGELRAAYRRDAATFRLLQDARRVDRFWQLRVRRRPYRYLLPPRTRR